MNLDEQLAILNDAYYDMEEDDTEKKEQILSVLKDLHVQLLNDPEALEDFVIDAALTAGGMYVPFLFWMELVKFFDDKGNDDTMFELIRIFATSDFEDEERKRMKPLLAIYFSLQREFEVDRIKAYIVDKSQHPDIRNYFNALFRFKEANRRSVEAYIHKFKLLKSYYPNFEMLGLPVAKLEEELA